jgi:EpsI family protein
MKSLGGFRFLVAAIMVTATLLRAHSEPPEVIPARLPLSSFPNQLGPWVGTDIPLDKETLEVLGHGDFLVRVYEDPKGVLSDVNLFVAYFPSQRTGDTIHSPQHCLPGAGWTPERNDRVLLSMPGHEPFPINRYVVSQAGMRKLVLYWYWAHDRGVASEYKAKYYLVKDAITMNRSDGALVRITADMLPGEKVEEAEKRLSPFTEQVLPLMNSYIPK